MSSTRNPIPWHYIWSPKYELFHKVLSFGIANCSDIKIVDHFFPQSTFTRPETTPDNTHFMAGISLKIDILIEALQASPGDHLILSDADIIVFDSAALIAYLDNYKQYDIVFMKEGVNDDSLNIGFGLIKSTSETIRFFIAVRDEIIRTGRQDQLIVNEFVHNYSMRVGTFSIPEVAQSNMGFDICDRALIVQALCSCGTSDDMMFEKLQTVSAFIDIRSLEAHVPPTIWKRLCDFHTTYRTGNPLDATVHGCATS